MSLQLVPFVRNSGVVVSLTFKYGRFRSTLGGIYGVSTSRSFPSS